MIFLGLCQRESCNERHLHPLCHNSRHKQNIQEFRIIIQINILMLNIQKKGGATTPV